MDKGMDEDKRIRNPRYFGYTKELESYSYKKALAIQILPIDDIIDIFTFEKTEVILTGNRVLCITQGTKMEDLNYWTLKYSDILNVKLCTEILEEGEKEKNLEDNEMVKAISARKVIRPLVGLDESKDERNDIGEEKVFKITVLYYDDTNKFGMKEIIETYTHKKSIKQAV
eukprot:CAMPEP_0205805268 /NCGR_PEP_ID=MMETSP0205-20121125/8445_1 /ASSEMBLY_ACC=CAM_ASM_000278 /TAXON_ID=36767 /ORGANISM="Euplotes focardii, Strain TN1" /LENGTH=170 /DNA_ID=CAMNT_0053076223 /DNA_START=287 /DNA_END=795 /DNA_ORIENTATION=-